MKRYSYYYPVILIVFSNVLYDISAKAFPKDLNAQAGLTAYYIIAAAVSLMLFYLTSEDKNFPLELKKVNWATFTLALGCTGIDLGYVLLFPSRLEHQLRVTGMQYHDCHCPYFGR